MGSSWRLSEAKHALAIAIVDGGWTQTEQVGLRACMRSVVDPRITRIETFAGDDGEMRVTYTLDGCTKRFDDIMYVIDRLADVEIIKAEEALKRASQKKDAPVEIDPAVTAMVETARYATSLVVGEPPYGNSGAVLVTMKGAIPGKTVHSKFERTFEMEGETWLRIAKQVGQAYSEGLERQADADWGKAA